MKERITGGHEQEPALREAIIKRINYDRRLTLGSEFLFQSREFNNLFNQSLKEATKIVLATLSAERSKDHSNHQIELLKLLCRAFVALLPDLDLPEYIKYHRNWLIRSKAADRNQGADVVNLFNLRAEKTGTPIVNALRAILNANVSTDRSDLGEWEESVTKLFHFANHQMPSRQEQDLDPFAIGKPAFPLLFRLFHIISNQFGIGHLNEAFSYHLLLIASTNNQYETMRQIDIFPFEEEEFNGLAQVNLEEIGDTGFSFEHHYNWTALVGDSGEKGKNWPELYQVLGGEVLGHIERAVSLIRSAKSEKGALLLKKATAIRRQIRKSDREVFLATGRYYYAAISYYYYINKDYRRSEVYITKALTSIQATVNANSNLISFAALCADGPLKMAQIARAQGNWDKMKLFLRNAHAVMLDSAPLCVLDDGTQIFHSTIRRRLETTYEHAEEQKLAVRYLSEPSLRLAVFKTIARKLYLIPGLV